MPGIAAFVAWNAAERLIAITRSHCPSGKSAIGDVLDAGVVDQDIEPAKLRGGLPHHRGDLARPADIRARIARPHAERGGDRPRSDASGSPNPFRAISAPSAASARAMPSPMPLVEPVTSATCLLRLMPNSFFPAKRVPSAPAPPAIPPSPSHEFLLSHRNGGSLRIDQPSNCITDALFPSPLPGPVPDPLPCRHAPLRHPLFRLLWSANVVVSLGVWMQNTGAGWLMTSLSPDPLVVTMVQAATIMPIFLLALPAGAFADIVDRRLFILGTQTWMLLAAATLPC